MMPGAEMAAFVPFAAFLYKVAVSVKETVGLPVSHMDLDEELEDVYSLVDASI